MRDEVLVLVEDTGEIVQPSGADLTAETLQTYARAKTELEALRLQREDMLRGLADGWPEYAGVMARMREAEATVGAIESSFDEAFTDEYRAELGSRITLDVGRVRVTWPKPSVRWVQRLKPAVVAERYPDIAAKLGIEQVQGKPGKPKVTLREAR